MGPPANILDKEVGQVHVMLWHASFILSFWLFWFASV